MNHGTNRNFFLLNEFQNSLNNNSLNQSIENSTFINNSFSELSSTTSNEEVMSNMSEIFSEVDLDIISEQSFEKSYYHQTKTCFNMLDKKNKDAIINTDIFGCYNINWERFYLFRNKNNVFNTYMEIAKIIKKFGPKSKINERVSRKYFLFKTRRICHLS